MCRFVAYVGPSIRLDSLVTQPVHGLVHQSFDARESRLPLNGDGFGLGWYAKDVSPEPAVFRSITPAWNDPNLRELCRVTRSDCVFAHVRAASGDLPVTRTNCHPFRVDRFLFMHNGQVPGFHCLRRQMMAGLSDRGFSEVAGSTDSEVLFAMFRDEYEQTVGAASGRMLEALERTIAWVRGLYCDHDSSEPLLLNLAVTDGEVMVATRYITGDEERAVSLHVHEGCRYECVDGDCHMVDSVDDEDCPTAVVIASEPLSHDSRWRDVPINHAVVVDEERRVRFSPLSI
ncbi:MAG: class II glutamine amidotransferase [Deltaproteobacteria bacterium]|nr:class II glutamine amidotransferase [Deltaproteobacteria bacterium]